MAATRLIAMHVNKGKSISQSLHDRTDYAKNPAKTEKGELVLSYHCDPMTVDEEFMLSKRQYLHQTGRQQKKDVIAYQIRQSFKPGEISPEKANKIGYELAMRFTKGQYAFIVATHTDRAHIHNHIVYNSTSIDGTKKFKDFWFSGLALQRCSDILCLEHGLSVIKKQPYGARKKRSEYPKRPKHRDRICEDIDRIMSERPESYQEFLQQLAGLGYEIKQGKHTAVKHASQKKFIRLSSLEDGYSEDELKAIFAGAKTFTLKKKNKSETNDNRLHYLVDVQKLFIEKGAGMKNWADKYNVKQMSKTLLYMRDHGIDSLEQLDQVISDKIQKRDSLLTAIKNSETRLEEIATLRKHIQNYSDTRSVYEAYRKSGYSKKYFEEHREEITIHKAAKVAFDKLGSKRIPRVKELNVEYAQVLSAKKQMYADYRTVKNETQELLTAQRNFAMIMQDQNDKKKERHKRNKNEYR